MLTGTRTTTTAATFTKPFNLGKDQRVLPAGMYTFHTREEIYEGGFDPVYLAISVEFEVREGAETTTRIVSPMAVTEAIERDRGQVGALSPLQTPIGGDTSVCMSVDDTLAEYGISREPVEVFHFGGYRYSNLKDAVASAQRARTASARVTASDR